MEESHPARRWFQFSLTDLFLYFLLFGLILTPPVVLFSQGWPRGILIKTYTTQLVVNSIPALVGGVFGSLFQKTFRGALAGLALWFVGLLLFQGIIGI